MTLEATDADMTGTECDLALPDGQGGPAMSSVAERIDATPPDQIVGDVHDTGARGLQQVA
jgi:hypothetical protein